MIQKNDFSFSIVPALLLWALNLIHAPFTWWSVSVGGGMEMAVLFPLFFIQIPSVILLFISALCMIVVRHHKASVIKNAVPAIVYILQVATFWLFAFYK